jgi:hypothetical protein
MSLKTPILSTKVVFQVFPLDIEANFLGNTHSSAQASSGGVLRRVVLAMLGIEA